MAKNLSCVSHGSLKRFPHTFTTTRDLLLIAVTQKVFQGFPKFLRSEYLIFRPVNKTLFTPACSLLDNSFCLYLIHIYSS